MSAQQTPPTNPPSLSCAAAAPQPPRLPLPPSPERRVFSELTLDALQNLYGPETVQVALRLEERFTREKVEERKVYEAAMAKAVADAEARVKRPRGRPVKAIKQTPEEKRVLYRDRKRTYRARLAREAAAAGI